MKIGETCSVLHIISSIQIVIEAGANKAVRVGDVFAVYGEGPELHGSGGESLGILEIPRGRGKIIHVQDKMATLETLESRREEILPNPKSILASLYGPERQFRTVKVPFEDVRIGDVARKVGP